MTEHSILFATALVVVGPLSCTEPVSDLEQITFIATPSKLAFEALPIGSSAAALVHLEGPVDLEVASVLLSDASSEAFSLALQGRAISVTFLPSTPGESGGSIMVRSNRGGVTAIELEGEGTDCLVQLQPSELHFGVALVAASVTLDVQASTECDRDLEAAIVLGEETGVCGATPAPIFCVEDDRLRVRRGEPATFAVRFTPQVAGLARGDVVLRWCDGPDCSATVRLYGDGADTADADIEVRPQVLDFGRTVVGARVGRQLSICNVGFDGLEVVELVADVEGTGAFSSIAVGSGVGPGGCETVSVDFTPAAPGAFVSSLLIRSDDLDEPEIRVELIGEGIDAPSCTYRIEPTELDFGVVPVGRTAGRSVLVHNDGASPCILNSSLLAFGSDPEFVVAEPLPEMLEPGAAAAVRVELAPLAAGTYQGLVELWIGSVDSPVASVELSGVGAEGTLLVAPDEVDFGEVEMGCSVRARWISVYNTGSTDAVIDDIAIIDDSRGVFFLASLPALPLVLPQGGSMMFEVSFTGGPLPSDWAAAVRLTVRRAGQSFSQYVDLRAETVPNAAQVDELVLSTQRKVDILLVVDHSPTMIEEHAVLVQDFALFDQSAQLQGVDYQLGVVTTDVDDEAGRLVHASAGDPFGGPLANAVITPASQPSPSAVLGQNVPARALAGGAPADESGLEAAYLALTQPLIGGSNAGFMRPDAALAIIFVSNADDASPASLDFYANVFLSLKGFRNSDLFSASAIVGDVPGGCFGQTGEAAGGDRYLELAARTGGVFESICSGTWTGTFSSLLGARVSVVLSTQPVITTIVVEVDGVVVPATNPNGAVNWTYAFATNSVTFAPTSTPLSGAAITIRYDAECL